MENLSAHLLSSQNQDRKRPRMQTSLLNILRSSTHAHAVKRRNFNWICERDCEGVQATFTSVSQMRVGGLNIRDKN